MEIGWFVLHPFNELPYVLVFQNSVDTVIVIAQFPLGKICVYLSVAYPVEEHYFPAPECAGDQMMPTWLFGKRPFAKRAIISPVHMKLYYTACS